MSLPVIVIITIVGYFALLMAVSYYASRGSDNSTFFTGKRQAPWPVVAFAMIGAAISGVTFISVPGMVAAKGYSYLQMVLGFIVGYALIAFVLVPLFYKRNLISIYGYLEERFGGSTYRTGAWFFFLSKMLGAAVRCTPAPGLRAAAHTVHLQCHRHHSSYMAVYRPGRSQDPYLD